MSAIHPYLIFNGNTEEAFTFYKSVFGGEFATVMRYDGSPGCENMPETDKNKIMHIALPVGATMIMGTDSPSSMEQVVFGTNYSLCIYVKSRDEADRVYKGLSEGGKATMPMQDMFWGDYYGMLTDKFDIQWMISFNPNNNN